MPDQFPFTLLAIQAAYAPNFPKLKPILRVEDLSSLRFTPKLLAQNLKAFLKEVAKNITNKGKAPIGRN